MSAYMSFFIRVNDKFYPIGTYSRSTAIYEMFEEKAQVPWEQIVPITTDTLNQIALFTDENKKGFEAGIETLYNKIDFIQHCDGELEDKLEEYNYCIGAIKDYESRIKELEWVNHFISFLEMTIEDAEETKWYDEVETIDPSKYIYAGIENGCPTVEDIKEE